MWSIPLTNICIYCCSKSSLTVDNCRVTVQYHFLTRRSSIEGRKKIYSRKWFLPSTNPVDSATRSCRIATSLFHWERVCGGSYLCVCVWAYTVRVCLWVCIGFVQKSVPLCRSSLLRFVGYLIELQSQRSLTEVLSTFTAIICWENDGILNDFPLPIYS